MVDGIIDNVDELGRLLFLKKWRTELGIDPDSYVEIVKKGDVLYIVPCAGEFSGTTGIVKKVDNLGRVVIPKKLRMALGIETSVSLEVCKTETAITVQIRQTCCCVCGKKPERSEVVLNLHGKIICNECSDKISAIKSGNYDTVQ